MIKRLATHRLLLTSLMSLATLVAAPHALAAANTVDQQEAAPTNIMQRPSYITYLRNNGFIIDIPANEVGPQRGGQATDAANDDPSRANDASYRAYLRLNGFTADETKSSASTAKHVGTDAERTANDASYAAYQRLNGFL